MFRLCLSIFNIHACIRLYAMGFQHKNDRVRLNIPNQTTTIKIDVYDVYRGIVHMLTDSRCSVSLRSEPKHVFFFTALPKWECVNDRYTFLKFISICTSLTCIFKWLWENTERKINDSCLSIFIIIQMNESIDKWAHFWSKCSGIDEFDGFYVYGMSFNHIFRSRLFNEWKKKH